MFMGARCGRLITDLGFLEVRTASGDRVNLNDLLHTKLTVSAEEKAMMRFQVHLEAATRNQARLKFVTAPLVKTIEPKLLDTLSQGVAGRLICSCPDRVVFELIFDLLFGADFGQMATENVVGRNVINELRDLINRTATRGVTRELTSVRVCSFTNHGLIVDATNMFRVCSETNRVTVAWGGSRSQSGK